MLLYGAVEAVRANRAQAVHMAVSSVQDGGWAGASCATEQAVRTALPMPAKEPDNAGNLHYTVHGGAEERDYGSQDGETTKRGFGGAG